MPLVNFGVLAPYDDAIPVGAHPGSSSKILWSLLWYSSDAGLMLNRSL